MTSSMRTETCLTCFTQVLIPSLVFASSAAFLSASLRKAWMLSSSSLMSKNSVLIPLRRFFSSFRIWKTSPNAKEIEASAISVVLSHLTIMLLSSIQHKHFRNMVPLAFFLCWVYCL
ncbi:hypothetical protein V8G54_026495 [Vigna mungo]|uniref:Uncharacterized protein n=1 Tax=Vigna mungo TaxID=3915 RepID=A0AAQ3N150_VIGMU